MWKTVKLLRWFIISNCCACIVIVQKIFSNLFFFSYHRNIKYLCAAGVWSVLAAYAWNVQMCMCTYRNGVLVQPFLYLKMQLNSVFVNAWPTRANRMAYDNTDCQSEDEQKEKPVAERRRSSLSELGSKLTSFILPLKTLVQPNPALQCHFLPAKLRG